MKKKRTFTVHRALEVLKYIPLVIWVVFFVFAFGWILLASFSTTREIFSGTLLDSGVHLDNYTNVWKDNNVGRYFINSILCSALSCAFIILISAPAAYVLSKKTFIGKKLTFNIFVVGMSIPQVMLIIPLYCWFVCAGLVGHLITLIILYTTLNVPYTVYFLTAFFSSVPSALAEAARIDGCSQTGALWRIMVPMASPGIITVTIFNFMNTWNEYFMALIFANGNDEIRTLSMGLQNIITAMTYTGNWAGLFAAVMMVFLPTFILYLLLSDKIVSGITGGGVKG